MREPLLPSTSRLFALAVITASTLAQQVVITRLFAAILAYHYSFLAISIAMLGTGAGALLVYARPAWFDADPRIPLARWSRFFAFALLLAPFGLARLDFAWLPTLDVAFAIRLLAACVLGALPPLASGVVVALAIDRYRDRIGTVYTWDLIGAGLGALGVVPLLWLGPAPLLLVGLSVVAAGAGALFAPPGHRERRLALAVAAAALVVGLVPDGRALLWIDPHYQLPDGIRLLADRWTPLARSMGYDTPSGGTTALLFYDRVYAPVPLVSDGVPPGWKKLRTGPASIGFEMAGTGPTLIIGGGGGRDIWSALGEGCRDVDVIELLEGNRRVVDDDLGDLSGHPYSRARTTIGDGRSVLAASRRTYDHIHIGFTDTLSANAAQGFALVENNLYTVEAFEEYLDHLSPRGVLNVSRTLRLVGDEALRVTVLALSALERRGVKDPFRHVVVILGRDFLGPPTGTVLVRREAWTPDEIERMRALASERAEGLLMVPGGPNRREWKALADAPSVQAFCSSYPIDVCETTDDRPFFFNMGRLRNLGALGSKGYHYAASPLTLLLLTLGLLLVLSVAAFAVPLRLAQSARRPTASSLVYFGAIGLGFLMLEIVLVQRFVLFLGFPTYALSVVLCALLVTSGLGAAMSARLLPSRDVLGRLLAATVGLLILGSFTLGPLLRSLIGLPFSVRVLIAMLILAPHGLLLGTAMPLGLRRFVAAFPESIPYAWGVNGVASVVASVLGIIIAVELGFTAASLAAAACYAIALTDVVRTPSPSSPASH